MTRTQRILLAASIAIAGTISYWQTGTVPDSPAPADRVCGRIALQMACSDLRQIKPAFPCAGGDAIVWFEVVADRSALEPEAIAQQFRSRVQVIAESFEQISCASAKNPAKTVTALDWADVPATQKCIAGMVSFDRGGGDWRVFTEPSVCCDVPGVGLCRCDDPPCVTVGAHQIAGAGEWRQRVCEQRPELCP